MKRLFIDFETRSTVDIKKVGGWAYSAHPSAEIMCLAYCWEGEEKDQVMVLTGEELKNGKRPWREMEDISKLQFVAHNAHFEYAIYTEILFKRYNWPSFVDAKHWDCTLARAAVCNLPISLEKCGIALGIASKKDLMGRAAMLKLCKPVGADPVSGGPLYNEDPELYRTLFKYCAGDVRAEMEIDARLPPLLEGERMVWELDLLMNRRGVRLDVPLARQAHHLVQGLTSELNGRLNTLTGGMVDKASRVQEIKRYLMSQGVATASLDKASVSNLLMDPDVPPHVKEVVDIRRQVGKTSTSKYEAILNIASPVDQRARGLFQYHGASTGRWAGRLLQPHNFPKGVGEAEQTLAVDAISSCDSPLFSVIYGTEAMDALSSALRGTIIASPGNQLVVADYNAIEPRVLFWLANEESALAAYRTGGSPYLDMGEAIFKRRIDKHRDPHDYAVAKFTTLGAGYGMGAPRFQAQCATAGVDISLDLAAQAIRAYRDKYSAVRLMWREVESTAKKAIRAPGDTFPCCSGKLTWTTDENKEFLRCRLPVGRYLSYYKPSIRGGEYGDEIHYQGPGLGGDLEDFKTYGGSLTENVVQAIARDIMCTAMLRLEARGFSLVASVHDELIAEIKEPKSKEAVLRLFLELMCELPNWAEGCPITAEGFVSGRYRK